MRFKTIFIVFNIVIVVSFLFIFFMPLILLGGSHFADFFLKNWFIIGLFVLTLALFNFYFISNWKFFHLLEREDWQALIVYLEERIYNKGQMRKSYIKILINAYLVTSNVTAIQKLKAHLTETKPELLKSYAIYFGIPYLLDNKPEESEKFFGKLVSEKNVKDLDWVKWNHAFSLMQLKEHEAAKLEFFKLIDTKVDPVAELLTLYMLSSFSNLDSSARSTLEARIKRFKAQHRESEWNKRLERSKGNIQVLIFTKIINDASDWISGYEPAPENRVLH